MHLAWMFSRVRNHFKGPRLESFMLEQNAKMMR